MSINIVPKKPTTPIIIQMMNEHNWSYFERHMRELNWDKISIHKPIPVEFMRRFRYKLVWHLVNRWNSIPEDLIEELVKEYDLSWAEVSEYQYEMSEDFIRKHIEDLTRFWLEENYIFSSSFMREFKDVFNIWEYIRLGRADRDLLEEMKDDIIQQFDVEDWNYMAYNDLPIYYFEVFRDQFDWDEVSKSSRDITPEFLNKFGHYLHWETCLQYKYFKMKFIKKYMNRFKWNWRLLCGCQQLSEDFIRKHENEVDWEALTFSNRLPLKLIEDMTYHFNERCWYNISARQRLTSDFVYAHLEQISLQGFSGNYKCKWKKDHVLYALELIERKRTGL